MQNQDKVKVNKIGSYYYANICGTREQNVFYDDFDYKFFMSLFELYLSKEDPPGQKSIKRLKLDDSVEVLAYCLMPNHFHLLVYQTNKAGLTKLVHGIMIRYSRYFNKKYDNKSPLFENCYQVKAVLSDQSLLDTSRSIHMTPDIWIDYPHSSLRAYLYDDAPCWMDKSRVANLYGSTANYFNFLNNNYKTHKKLVS
jgi:putative transposase